MSRDLSKNDTERLMFLRADLSSLKIEIARRSALQERALALYFAVVAFAALRVPGTDSLLLVVPSVWLAAWLTTNFWTREHLEIVRLKTVLCDRVAALAASILECPAGMLVPSEIWGGNKVIDPRTRCLHVQFRWISFVGIPAFLTVLVFWRRFAGVPKLYQLQGPHALLGVVSAVAAIRVAWMLFGGTRVHADSEAGNAE